MARDSTGGMARGRAILTEREREQIAGKDSKQRKYEAVSRARARVQEELGKDIELLEQHHPELLQEIQDVVCNRK